MSKIETTETQVETEARAAKHCPACGQRKEIGNLVCWYCFKVRPNPLKWFDGTFEDWMRKQGAKI